MNKYARSQTMKSNDETISICHQYHLWRSANSASTQKSDPDYRVAMRCLLCFDMRCTRCCLQTGLGKSLYIICVAKIHSTELIGRFSPDTSVNIPMVLRSRNKKEGRHRLTVRYGSASHAVLFWGLLLFLLPLDTPSPLAEKRVHANPHSICLCFNSTSRVVKDRAARRLVELADSISYRVPGFNAERIKYAFTGPKIHLRPWHLSRHADRHGR